MSLSSWTRSLTRRGLRGPIVAAVASLLLVGAVINSGMAVAGGEVTSPVDGSYYFNANGWVGTLTVTAAETGVPGIAMYYSERGTTEFLSGGWDSGTGTLTVYRPLSGGVSQSYTLYLGNHHPTSPVFGGFFTESDTGTMRYGVYADAYLAPGVARASIAKPALAKGTAQPNTVHPAVSVIPDNLIGDYTFDGNGWDGELLLDDDGCPSANIEMTYYELGTSEAITNRSWNAATGTLTLVRPLAGGVTQTYTMYIGTHRSQYFSLMFGGYFTESDTGSGRYATFADHVDGGVGC